MENKKTTIKEDKKMSEFAKRKFITKFAKRIKTQEIQTAKGKIVKGAMNWFLGSCAGYKYR